MVLGQARPHIDPMESILVLDDDPGFRHAAASALRRAGFTVTQAANCWEAPDQATRTSFDLLMLDVSLEDDIDGLTFGRLMKERGDNLKVMYVTGHALEAADMPDKVLLKPVENEQLVAAAAALLRDRPV